MELNDKIVEEATEQEEGNALAIGGLGLLILLPAAMALHFLDLVAWQSWTAVAVGTLGLLTLAVAAVVATKEPSNGHDYSELLYYTGGAVIAAKFVHDVWQFLT